VSIAQARRDMRAEQLDMKLPGESDPWVQEHFRRPDGSFDALRYHRWLQEETARLLGPVTVTMYDYWMEALLKRVVEESNMFYGGMVPLLPTYFRGYDEVPWEEATLWARVAAINERIREERSHAGRRSPH